MALITAGIAFVSAALASVTVASVQAFAIRTLVTIGISKLVSNRANKGSVGANDVGARVQLGPATNNKLPVLYGSGFLAPVMTDAKITTDQKTMYYVFSLSEASSGTMSFGKIFWNGKEVTLGAGDYSANNKVVSLTTNSTPPQVDDTINGYAWIYQFNNGSSSGVNTGGTSAITILQDAGIPVADRWTSTDLMTNTCFIIVKVIYNRDVQDVHGDPKLSVQLTNTLTKPGAVFLDYMTNSTYGCAIDVANIDTASLTALDVYSDELITYVPVGGGSATQPRYRIDGPVNTGDNCLSNLQELADSCDSWLQYSELTGKWTIVMNKPYSGTLSSLYSVDSSVLIGGIDINPLDLNQTYNSLEVQYPNANINDQTDYKVVDLTTVGTAWYNPSLLSPNEPNNRLVIQYSQINNYVRAVYLGVRRLLQSREDLTITCNLDYSGIQITAGDVVRVTLAEYGWVDKLFRVSQVQETKTSEGFLGARITAFEYNANVYNDNALDDFIPAANTGLKDPNIFDRPTTPIVTLAPVVNGAINYYSVSSNVPAVGTTLYMDFNIGNSSNIDTHKSYSSVQVGDGTPYTANSTITINVADSSPGTYYWSATARNDFAGRQSNSSAAFTWVGPSVTQYDPTSNIGGIGYVNINPTASPEERMSLIAFGIADVVGNTVIMPVQANANVILNNPIYLDGTALNANYYYPYYQNTSTTANGYLATSTSSFQPARASFQVLDNGDDNWYVFVYDNFGSSSNYPLDPTEYFKLELNATFIANTDSVIQLGAFYTSNNTGTLIYHDTTIDGTYILPANVPTEINFVQAYGNSANNVTDGGGFIMKNIIGNTRAITLYTKLELYKGRLV
jgi:hypothetical protein